MHILHILCVQVGGYSHGLFCMAESSEEQNDTCIGNEITVGHIKLQVLTYMYDCVVITRMLI